MIVTYLEKQLFNNFLFVHDFLHTTPFIFVESLDYIRYNKIRENEFDDIVSRKDKVKDLNLNQLKLEVGATYKKDEKITTHSEPTHNSDVLNKAYIDKTLSEKEVQISYIEKDFKEFILHNSK